MKIEIDTANMLDEDKLSLFSYLYNREYYKQNKDKKKKKKGIK